MDYGTDPDDIRVAQLRSLPWGPYTTQEEKSLREGVDFLLRLLGKKSEDLREIQRAHAGTELMLKAQTAIAEMASANASIARESHVQMSADYREVLVERHNLELELASLKKAAHGARLAMDSTLGFLGGYTAFEQPDLPKPLVACMKMLTSDLVEARDALPPPDHCRGQKCADDICICRCDNCRVNRKRTEASK